MADSRPTGKLMTGAVGNFLLGGAMALMALSGAAAGMMGGSSTASGGLGLIAFILIVGGGICAALGWFGLGSLYGGTNTLAGVFSILLGLMPIALIVFVLGAAESASRGGFDNVSSESAVGAAKIIFVILFGIPALTGIFGGLGAMSAKTGIAKPAGIVLLISGAALAALAVMGILEAGSLSLFSILLMVGFYGSAIGFILAGVTMIGERSATA